MSYVNRLGNYFEEYNYRLLIEISTIKDVVLELSQTLLYTSN